MMQRLQGIILLLVLAGFTSCEIRVSLNSDKWTARNENGSISVPAVVPGGIYSDLQRAGVIGDIFYRQNDQETRWVARDNWTYHLDFSLDDDVLSADVINLVFYGLDTVADISLNGQPLGSVANMFTRHVLSVKDIAQQNNSLQVAFQSPILAAADLSNQHNYSIPPDCVFLHGECHFNFLRKMQSSFSWDWGPAFPSMGIWRTVEVEAFNSFIIRDLQLRTIREDDGWDVDVKVYVDTSSAGLPVITNYETSLTFPGEDHVFTTDLYAMGPEMDKNNSYIVYFGIWVPDKMAHVWWPNGYGDQNLYNLTVSLDVGDESCSRSYSVGLRTIELVQTELQPGLDGLSFYFKVNDVPIFAKGANWIPGDILPENGVKPVDHLLLSAKEAHMNMIRVWGGGIYESDEFYQTADKYGLLVWQDMMFAVALYPANEEFLKLVRVEAEQAVRRLQRHACIAIWSGNNEIEAAIGTDWYGLGDKIEIYKQDYRKLFVDTIEKVLKANEKTIPYVFSSPSNGLETIEEDYIAKNPLSLVFGDVHYYNYGNDPWNESLYYTNRFASEYGFQGMPSYYSLVNVSEEDDRKLSSEFTQSRQHHPNGYVEMTNLARYHLPLEDDDDSEQYYRIFIYYTQISQAMGTRTESEKYRRERSLLTEDNLGNTMGALYWQLNDVWQAPSWSSIEYNGKWKMLHYHAKHFFAPVIVTFTEAVDGTIDVYVVSDLLQDVNGQLNISVYSYDDLNPRKTYSSDVTIANATSKIYWTMALDKLLSESNCKRTTCFLYMSITYESTTNDNILYLSPLTDVENLKTPSITITTNPGKAKSPTLFTLEIETDNIAPFLWLEADETGRFSDNGFTLLQKSVTIQFDNRGEVVDYTNFVNTLRVSTIKQVFVETRKNH